MVQDLPDKTGNVDVRGTGPGARRVVAEETAGGLGPRLIRSKGRVDIGKVGEAGSGSQWFAQSWPPGMPAKVRGIHCPRPSVPTTL